MAVFNSIIVAHAAIFASFLG